METKVKIVGTEEQKQAVKSFLHSIIQLAEEEGRKEKEKLGRNLTQEEAKRISDMIMRQAQTAIIMSKT